MTLEQIRNDLKDIKYYNSRKELLDKAIQLSGKSETLKKIDLYNTAMQSASPKLLDIYYSLYFNNHTQESLADELGFTIDYIYKMNKQLLKFLQKQLSEAA